jgi:spore coat protein U-like protein
MFNRKALRTACLMAACCATAVSLSSANAATATSNMAVSATVQATCYISAAAMAFGTYTGSSTPVDQTADLTVSCTNSTTYEISLDDGTTAGGSIATRKMARAGGGTLDYRLYSDSGHTTVWGETAATDTVAGTGNGAAQTITVYGRVLASQLPTPGAYADTVVATVTY